MPSLSIDKLRLLLTSKGFVPIRYFVMDEYCYYIEVLDNMTMECSLMYIPSRYKFKMEIGENAYKIKYAEFSADDETEVTSSTIILSPDKKISISDYIEGYYDQPIKLKNMYASDITMIRSICKQLIRIKNSVQHLKYKTAILYKNYICAIKRDNSIEVFVIKHFKIDMGKKMLVVFDLELLDSQNERVHVDITSIKKGLYTIFEKNQLIYTKILDKLSESKQESLTITNNAKVKIKSYEEQIKKIEDVLPLLNIEEEKLLRKIEESVNDKSFSSLEVKASLDSEMQQMKKNKDEIINTLDTLRSKRENLLMNIDRVFFENAVMFDKILKNFASLL